MEMEKFDFSKIEDQKKFEKLPEKEQEKIVGEAQGEAAGIQKKVENGDLKNSNETTTRVSIEDKEKEKISAETITADALKNIIYKGESLPQDNRFFII